jgi:hypothetical protein
LNDAQEGVLMGEEKTNNTGEPEKSHDHEGQAGEPLYPLLLDYLQSKEGHELASRIVAILEDVKKATIESATERLRATKPA